MGKDKGMRVLMVGHADDAGRKVKMAEVQVRWGVGQRADEIAGEAKSGQEGFGGSRVEWRV